MDYRERYKERKSDVLDLLKSSVDFYTRMEDADRVDSLSKLSQQVENDKFSIVVVGQFSAGKSTFLNALMGERYLPSFTTETTATVNFLRSVKESPTGKPLIRVNYKDGMTDTCEEVTLENIEKYVSTKGDHVAQKVASVEVFLDSPYLNDGVALVDSPGLNGVLEGHEQITNEQIDRSHAAIFMFNAHQPGSQSDFEKLKMLTDRCKSVLIVLNQKDLIKESEQSVEEVVQNVKENYKKFFNTDKLPEIYPLSSYMALVARSKKYKLDFNGRNDFSDSEKQDFLSQSDFEVFEERLDKYLTQGEKAKESLNGPVEKVKSFLHETETSLKSQIEQISNATDADEIRLKIDSLKDEEQKLSEQLNNNRTVIRNKVSEILRNAKDGLQSEAYDLKQDCIAKINSAEDLEELESNSQLYVNIIQGKYHHIWEKTNSLIKRRFSELITTEYNSYASAIEEKLGDFGGIQFAKMSLDSNVFEIDVDIDNLLQERDRILQEMDANQDRIDDYELKQSIASENQRKQQRLQAAKDRMKDDYRTEIELLGPRPDIERYQDYRTKNVSGIKGLFKWIWSGNSGTEYEYYTAKDSSQRDAYDKEKQRITSDHQMRMAELEQQIGQIKDTNSCAYATKMKQLERENERMQKRLDELEQQTREDKAKTIRKQQRRAKAYVEGIIESIENENLNKIYEQLDGNNDMMTNAALDVIQMKLQGEISRKKNVIETLEKQLSASQEEKDAIIEKMSNQLGDISVILDQANICAEELNSIQTDEIKIS